MPSPRAPPQPTRFETLLFRLPAELRLEIYTCALSPSLTVSGKSSDSTLDLLADNRSLQWLTISATVFAEAAPLLYSKVPLHFALDLGDNTRWQSLCMLLYSHAEMTYLHDRKWAYTAICEMAREVVIDMPLCEYRPHCNGPAALTQADWDRWPDRWRVMRDSRDPLGHLSGPRLFAARRIPFLPAVRKVTLNIRGEYLLTQEQEKTIEEVWHGEEQIANAGCSSSSDLVLNAAPFLHDVRHSVLLVNTALRQKLPAVREMRWDLELSRTVPRRGLRYAATAKRFMELFVMRTGQWKSGETKKSENPPDRV